MKTLCLLFIFTVMSYHPSLAQCIGPNCPPPVFIAPQPVPVYNVVPPPVIYRPQVQWQPLQYQGSVYQPRTYRTPLRNWFFGVGTFNHYYAPQGQQ